MNLAAGFNVLETWGLHERSAAAREVIQPLLVLTQREPSHEDV